MTKLASCYLRALAYADLFDYPLTAAELKKYAIAPLVDQKIPPQDYFYLPGRQKLVSLRRQKETWNQSKLVLAHCTANFLSLIPSVKMVGLTGALAMNNAAQHDDIDFLIITTPNRLWLTRFFVTLVLQFSGTRRQPEDVNINNKICPNIYLSDNHLAISKNEQDLFSAHEVCQLKPLFDRDHTYQKFLHANKWALTYLPNGFTQTQSSNPTSSLTLKFIIDLLFQILNLKFIEVLLRKLQLSYMRKKRTIERVSSSRAFFHPHDHRQHILSEYQRRLDKYHIPR